MLGLNLFSASPNILATSGDAPSGLDRRECPAREYALKVGIFPGSHWNVPSNNVRRRGRENVWRLPCAAW